MSRPKTALVLSGGGSRGLAHVGVLKVLQREGIAIDLLVGTSIGGVVAAAFALGIDPEEIGAGLYLGMERSYPRVRGFRDFKLISARERQYRVGLQLRLALGERTFADLLVPTRLMAVDMLTGQEVVLRRGPLLPALLATTAIPGIFPPVVMDQMQLADGAVIDNLATHVAAAEGADRIIAVDVSTPLIAEDPWDDPVSAMLGRELPLPNFGSRGGGERGPSLVTAIWRSIRIMGWRLHEERLERHPPDVLLRPAVLDVGTLGLVDAEPVIQAGVDEAEAHLAALRALRDGRQEEK